MDYELEQSLEQLEQIDEVIQDILAEGIPQEPERLRTMIIILGRHSRIEDPKMLFSIWRLRQDLIHIAAVYRSE